jgi:hypothetical protein
MVRISSTKKGQVWLNVNGGWKHGEHFLKRDLSKFVVSAGPYVGLVFKTLSEGMEIIGKLDENKASLMEESAAAEPNAEDWASYGEHLAERWEAERAGWMDGMEEEYKKTFPNSQDDDMPRE